MHAISRRPTVLVDAGDSPFELPISSLARAILVKARAASASQMTRAKKERDLARHLALEFVAEEHQFLRFATGSGPRMLPSTTHWWTSTTSLNIKNPTTHRLAQELADLLSEREPEIEFPGGSYDPQRDNDIRANRGALALVGYAQLVAGGSLTDEAVSAVSDLLSDLRHLCDGLGIDWEAAVASSDTNYRDEILGL